MRIPVMKGTIERRVLANFRVDPEVMKRNLPSPFRPLLVKGYAIAGICLIRLAGIRPRALPVPFGIKSENAAHRIAVEWGAEGEQGVYIPRRDSNSRLNALAGGTVFPGVHHYAHFDVEEVGRRVSIGMQSSDGAASVEVRGEVSDGFPTGSVFSSLAEASRFFELGSLGYSDTRTEGRFDGLELRCPAWEVQNLEVEHVASSYFEDKERFPEGSVTFDCALYMEDIHHEWHGRSDLFGEVCG